MDPKLMKEKLEEAKRIHRLKDFRAFMRGLHGFTDEDFERLVPEIEEIILESKQTNPVEMFESVLQRLEPIWKKPPLPLNADWHHFIVPGVLLASLRNRGYPVDEGDIREGIERGRGFLGGSCGFAGTCGGAFGVGIVLSMVKRTTPLHDKERSQVMEAVSDTLAEIAKYPRRCCKRSSYIAIRKAVEYLNREGYDALKLGVVECRWHAQNRMCLGSSCPFSRS
jgi:hypothetical protein